MSTLVLNMQKRCKEWGFDPGPLDGDIGPKTHTAFMSAVAGRRLGSLGVLLGRGVAVEFPKHHIVTPLRISHWVAQMAHETGGFRHLVELGSGDGPDADPWDDYLERYDFRADLGHNAGGLGEKYRGRGLIHLTGLSNYRRYGKRVGVDLEKYPQRAAEPEIAVAVACLYWSDKQLNLLADSDNVRAITRKINGGYNGLQSRVDKLNRGKALWGL